MIDDFIESIQSVNEEATFPLDMKSAIIGSVDRAGGSTLFLIDREKCLNILMTRGNMTYDEAIDFFDVNIICSWVGEGTPCYCDSI